MNKKSLFDSAELLAGKAKSSSGWRKWVYIGLAIGATAAGLFFCPSCSGHELAAGYDKQSGAFGVVVRPVRISYSKK